MKVVIESIFITEKQIKEVERILELEGNTKEELQTKRNSVVKIIGGLSHEYRMKDDFQTIDKYHNCMSGVVAVIDLLYYY